MNPMSFASSRRLFILFLLCLFVIGCSSQSPNEPANLAESNETAPPPPPKPPEPVTLKLYPYQPMTDEDFQQLIAEPVNKKHPHLTVELVPRSSVTLENIAAFQEQVDLMLMWHGSVSSFIDLGLYEDLTPHIKQHQFDLSRFDPKTLSTIQEISPQGHLYGIPYNVQFYALYYNKDLFDRFGVQYPRDGLYWDDLLEVSRQMTRNVDGVQYSGLDMDNFTRLSYPLSLIPVDAATNKPSVNNEAYRKVFDFGKRLYSIPGNTAKLSSTGFIRDETLSMLASVNLISNLRSAKFNWDIAQYPSYAESPNTYGMYDLHIMMMTSISKHKAEALQVIDTFLSDEVQLLSTSKTGRVSPLANANIRSAFGSDMPELNGKNVQGIFKSDPAYCPPFSLYQSPANAILRQKFLDAVSGKTDINTALREAHEEIEQLIRTMQS